VVIRLIFYIRKSILGSLHGGKRIEFVQALREQPDGALEGRGPDISMPAASVSDLCPFSSFDAPTCVSYSRSMTLHVVIERGEDGYFSARCPSLKSCWSQGRDREEALRNIQEVIELYLEPSPEDLVQDETHEVIALTV
jgi:predicted RNase H-like HicB family nuclease